MMVPTEREKMELVLNDDEQQPECEACGTTEDGAVENRYDLGGKVLCDPCYATMGGGSTRLDEYLARPYVVVAFPIYLHSEDRHYNHPTISARYETLAEAQHSADECNLYVECVEESTTYTFEAMSLAEFNDLEA